jgi:uncharacterized membrane protein
MSDEMGSVPPEAQQQGYQQVPPPPQYIPPAQASGLSDTAAGALAYITIIPAIIFLLIDPYKDKPFVKFHSIQCLGLAICGFCLGVIAVIPILGWIIYIVGMLTMLVVWIICILKASQGGAFKLPVIGKFASDQSGYTV